MGGGMEQTHARTCMSPSFADSLLEELRIEHLLRMDQHSRGLEAACRALGCELVLVKALGLAELARSTGALRVSRGSFPAGSRRG